VASYPENTKGIIEAINACILALGGTVVSYPHNTGGIIQALLALETALAASGSGSTALIIPLTAGEALSSGDAVYLSSSSSKVYKAENDDTREKATVFGFVNAAVAADGDEASVVVRGKVVTSTSSLTVGTAYYLSSTAGAITATAPSTSGDFTVPVGQAISTTEIDVKTQIPVEQT
jgi:hypothetical protein